MPSVASATSGSAAQHVARAAHADQHHADRVRDDVVQLAGDRRALLVHGDPGQLLALALEQRRAALAARAGTPAASRRRRRAPTPERAQHGEDRVEELIVRRDDQLATSVIGAVSASAASETRRSHMAATVYSAISGANRDGVAPAIATPNTAASDTPSVASGCRRRSTRTAPATNASPTATGGGERSEPNTCPTSTAAAASATQGVERPRAPARSVRAARAPGSCDVAPLWPGVRRLVKHWLPPWEDLVTACGLDIGRGGGVRELAELAADHERDLLADVDRVVADSLDVARDQHRVRGPLAGLRVAAADLDRLVEDLAVERGRSRRPG